MSRDVPLCARLLHKSLLGSGNHLLNLWQLLLPVVGRLFVVGEGHLFFFVEGKVADAVVGDSLHQGQPNLLQLSFQVDPVLRLLLKPLYVTADLLFPFRLQLLTFLFVLLHLLFAPFPPLSLLLHLSTELINVLNAYFDLAVFGVQLVLKLNDVLSPARVECAKRPSDIFLQFANYIVVQLLIVI